MFIGEKEIVKVENNELDILDRTATITFADGSVSKIHEDLLDLVQEEVQGNGNVTDKVNDYFARKFVAELAQYDLGFYLADSIGMGMATLTHNLREQLLSKTFNCSGGNDISLKLLVQSVDIAAAE